MEKWKLELGSYSLSDELGSNRDFTLVVNAEEAFIDGIYYCPHHPEGTVERYAIQCDCRKPGLGMLTKAAEDHGIDLKHSYLVGDKLSDVKCAQKAGMISILVLTGYGKDEMKKITEIVKSAIGYKNGRDEIKVHNMLFQLSQ